MKRFFLLRHAKSLRDEARKDKDRPLNTRGRNDAPRMGGYMHHRHYLPALVLCSTAKRTVETWELLGPELDGTADVRFLDSLYLAPDKTIEKIVRSLDDGVSSVLVLGHNPGLEDCAKAFAREPASTEERKLNDELRTKFPTCALAVFDFDVTDWVKIERGTGALIDYARPKGLAD